MAIVGFRNAYYSKNHVLLNNAIVVLINRSVFELTLLQGVWKRAILLDRGL